MMTQRKPTLGRKELKIWAFLFTALFVLSKALYRGAFQGAGDAALETILGSTPGMMHLAAVILILEAVSACGVLLYAAMLLQGMEKTGSRTNYMIRVGLLAVISEIPYDLLNTGKTVDAAVQNPIFGLLICQVMILFWNQHSGRKLKSLLIRIFVLAAAAAWCFMLRVDFGLPLLLCTAILWLFRENPSRRGFGGMLAGALCILLSPFFLASPMAALLLHFYNGEDWNGNNRMCYLAFPVLLILGWGLTFLM